MATQETAVARAIPAPRRRDALGSALRWLGKALFTLNGWGGYVFLYAPIVILVIFSFNAGRSTASMQGLSLKWYADLFQDEFTIAALRNSLIVAVSSTIISTVFGTMAALAMERYQFWGKLGMDALLYLPIIIPDIAMAIMLLMFFNVSGIGLRPLNVFGVGLPITVIISHVAFNISFVAVVVRARLVNFDRTLEEAAADLYANPWRVFTRVTLPLIMPGILGGALLAFTLSLDDFVITFFTSPVGFNTLPTRIYGMVKKGITPKINALSSVVLAASLGLVMFSLLTRRGGEKGGGIDLV